MHQRYRHFQSYNDGGLFEHRSPSHDFGDVVTIGCIRLIDVLHDDGEDICTGSENVAAHNDALVVLGENLVDEV